MLTVLINDKQFASDNNELEEVLSEFGAKPPYVVAINGEFVAKHLYQMTTLQEGDKVEVLSPIFGG